MALAALAENSRDGTAGEEQGDNTPVKVRTVAAADEGERGAGVSVEQGARGGGVTGLLLDGEEKGGAPCSRARWGGGAEGGAMLAGRGRRSVGYCIFLISLVQSSSLGLCANPLPLVRKRTWASRPCAAELQFLLSLAGSSSGCGCDRRYDSGCAGDVSGAGRLLLLLLYFIREV